MPTGTLTRRAVMTSAALAPLLTSHATAQQALSPPSDRKSVTDFHRSQLDAAAALFNDEPFLSEDNLNSLIDALVEGGLLKPEDADFLRELVRLIIQAEDIANMIEKVVAFIEDIFDKLGEVARTITGVVADSVDYARDTLADLPIERASRVILHDLAGALNGAGGGAALGSAIPGLGTAAGAIIGALAAGASGSIIGYFDDARREA